MSASGKITNDDGDDDDDDDDDDLRNLYANFTQNINI